MSNPQPPEGSAPDEGELFRPVRFDDRGLVTAVAQDALTGEVRMVAYMNREALALTARTGEAHFFSRSRNALWKKGETSGNTLAVRSLRLDCDGDCVLVLVEPAGPSCHTGARSCFYREARPADGSEGRGGGAWAWVDAGPPAPMAERLEAVLASRRQASAAQSYTRKLFDGGAEKIGAKLREEADELSRAVAGESDERVASEAADVAYHALAGLVFRGVPWRAVLAELARRFGTSGIEEKAARGKKG